MEVGNIVGGPVTPRLARYLWAAPNSLIGLLFLPSTLFTSGGCRAVDGVLELHSGFIAWVLRACVPLPGGAAAMTLGHVVLGRDPQALARTRAHERVHVRQCERWGPGFIPAYLLASTWGLVTGAGMYHGNWFEREAFEGERAET
ncbi:MAG: hypothetical protein JNM53_08150 [Gemmatimonadetes bacterium]|nr:hypothetical protein [Gemmatimonadota bacterium]